MKTNIKFLVFCLTLTLYVGLRTLPAIAQENNGHALSMKEALQLTLTRQELLKAKANYANASKENITAARRDGSPDFILSAQQGYGTINGLNGLPSGINGLISTTSGPVSASQNWNAAFGALYSSEINWNIFSFGLQKAHVADARGVYDRDEADLEQEKFQQQVRAASAYLNLLDAQRLHYSEEVNLSRVSALRDVILTRTVNGLNAGVDSSIANAQLSQAKNALTDAIAFEQKQASNLAIQLGMTKQDFLLDSLYINQLPAHLPQGPVYDISNHPQLRFLAQRVKSSELDAAYLSKTSLPKVSFFGTLQDRGSGFGTGYNPADPGSYNQGYFNGIAPLRGNYLIGVGVSWNLSNMGRVSSRLKSQRYYADGLTNEYHYQETNLSNQLEEGNKQLVNALQKYREAPILLKAASDAYEQKKTLYSNGLATIVDVTQTLYDLNRAETNRDIAGNAVWQALLYMAGSSGNLDLFTNQY